MEWYYYATVAAACPVALVLLEIIWRKVTAPGYKVANTHVFITGGSAGLGLAMAKAVVARGCLNITLVARSVDKLNTAKKEILKLDPEANVYVHSADVTDYNAMQTAVEKSIVHHAMPINQLICCAGFAKPGYFIDTPVETFHYQMEVNYYGSLHAIKAVLPNMVDTQDTEQQQRIVLVSSACGYIGFIGYTQYCATKYALRGLADCLRNELLQYKINVSIFYPGNMDTPGFEIEEKTKPAETREIEGTSELVSAESAAQSLIDGISAGQYAITNDIGVWLLRVVGNGMAPRSLVVLETLISPLVNVIQTIYVAYMDYVVKKSCRKKSKSE